MENVKLYRNSRRPPLGGLSIPARFVPIWTLTFWTDARLVLCVAWNPFMATSFATVAPNFDLYFWHNVNIYLENNILSSHYFLDMLYTSRVIYRSVVNHSEWRLEVMDIRH